ncbi:MAG: hypothetical protein CBB87_10405 [Micavibrio sp. TMED27]|nr:hypothetical protein [Micavibrio sp.]OUT90166.1 MAG: hypothetical protein CBB87_10405 [Micavibrio sp. TMED27]
MKKTFLSSCVLTMCVAIGVSSIAKWSHADDFAQPLVYEKAVSQDFLKELQAVLQFADNQLLNAQLSKIDLNEDGLDEYIVRDGSCIDNHFCEYGVVAKTNQGYINLLRIKSFNLMLGNEYTKGVRNLRVYNNRLNDFNYTTYIWSTSRLSYVRDTSA